MYVHIFHTSYVMLRGDHVILPECSQGYDEVIHNNLSGTDSVSRHCCPGQFPQYIYIRFCMSGKSFTQVRYAFCEGWKEILFSLRNATPFEWKCLFVKPALANWNRSVSSRERCTIFCCSHFQRFHCLFQVWGKDWTLRLFSCGLTHSSLLKANFAERWTY